MDRFAAQDRRDLPETTDHRAPRLEHRPGAGAGSGPPDPDAQAQDDAARWTSRRRQRASGRCSTTTAVVDVRLGPDRPARPAGARPTPSTRGAPSRCTTAGLLPPVPGRAAQALACARSTVDAVEQDRPDRGRRRRAGDRRWRHDAERWPTAAARRCAEGAGTGSSSWSRSASARSVKFAVGQRLRARKAIDEEDPHEQSRNVAVILAGGVGARVGSRHPQAADQDRRAHDPRAHPRRARRAPGRRRDRGDDGARATSTPCTRSSATAATPRSRHILEGAETRNGTTSRALEVRRTTTTPRCCSTTRCARWSAPASSPSASRPSSTYDAVDVAIPSADTIIEVDERQHHPRHPAARQPAPRPDPAGLPASARIRAAYAAAAPGPRLRGHRRLQRRAALPARGPDLGGGRRGAQHEGDRADRRLPRRQALPADLRRPAPRALSEELPRGPDAAGRWSSSAAATASAPTSPTLAERVRRRRCSPSAARRTSTHVERREDIARGRGPRCWRRPVRSTTSSTPRPSSRAGASSRPPRRRSTRPPRSTTSRPCMIAQEFYPHLRRSRGSLLYFTSSSYTRGRSGYSLYSSAKAAVVNLTQALADEWSGDGVSGQLHQPRAHRHADAHQGVRPRAGRIAAGVERGGPAVPGRAGQRRDRP